VHGFSLRVILFRVNVYYTRPDLAAYSGPSSVAGKSETDFCLFLRQWFTRYAGMRFFCLPQHGGRLKLSAKTMEIPLAGGSWVLKPSAVAPGSVAWRRCPAKPEFLLINKK
jgi:hypothetical protein